MGKVYKLKAFWDGEAKVWVAESVEVPGLCTEAATMEQLVKKGGCNGAGNAGSQWRASCRPNRCPI